MSIQRVAQVFGVVFILAAVAGFIAPGGMGMESSPDAAAKALGLFPVNLLHNIVHLVFGIWGLVAARSFSGAKSYATIGGAIYLLLAVLGFVAPDGFGLVPLGGHDIWLHVVLGLGLLFFGATAKAAPATV